MATLYFPSKDETRQILRRVTRGELFRIRNGIYIDTKDKNEQSKTLESRWMDVACFLFANPVAVARTAVELKPTNSRLYFISSHLIRRRTVEVGHLKFDVSGGNDDAGVEQIGVDLRRSNPARYCL